MSERIPKGWSVCAVGELGEIVGGGTPSSEIEAYWDGSVMWATPSEITKLKTRYISTTYRTITEEGLQHSSAKLHPEGTLLLTSRASIGYPAINVVPMATNQGFQSLRPNEKLNVEYGYQLLLHSRIELEKLAAGSTFLEISSKEVSKFKLPVPPLAEQKKIASILTSVDEVIENTQKQIEKLQDLKKATMNELLTKGIGHTEFKDSELGRIPKSWEILKADDLCKKITKGTTPSKNFVSSFLGVPFIRVNNLGFDGELHFENGLIFVDSEVHEGALSRSRIFPMDVLMNIVGPPLGKVAIVSNRFEEYNTNQAVVLFRTDQEKINVQYFLEFLMSELAQKWFSERAKKTSGQENLTIELAKLLPVPLPAKNEQVKIANAIQSIKKLIQVRTYKLKEYQSLKKSLMQDLLTGKIRVQVH